MAEEEQTGEIGVPPEMRRYCSACGEIFVESQTACPTCGFPWGRPSRLEVGTLVTLLTDMPRLRDEGVLDEPCYSALRATYEHWLTVVRPPRYKPAERPLPATVMTPASEPRTPRPSVAQWTAARQADILLYLGAFLLSIAALVFVGAQGSAFSGMGRLSILLVYTIAFLTLGLNLPRWERVREAGAVFLALGALLVPINFIALRTQVLSSSPLPDSIIWLAGSTVTAGLYLALSRRGHGLLYGVVGAAATVVAWGSLGAALQLPIEWFGAWYAGAAAAANTVWIATRRPGERWIAIGTGLIGAGGLLYAQTMAFFVSESKGELYHQSGTSAELPVAYALAGAGVAANLYLRRPTWAKALLPPLLALTVLTGCWSVFGLSSDWYAGFAAAAGLGYLVLAELDSARRLRWRWSAAAAGLVALAWAHTVATTAGTQMAQLPLTYAIVLVGACWDAWRRRDRSLLVLPALGAMTLTTVFWASGVPSAVWAYPWLAAAGVMVATEPWWRGSNDLAKAIWPYLLALAALPPLVLASYLAYSQQPAHGLIAYLITAGVFLLAAARAKGALVGLFTETAPGAIALAAERLALGSVGRAFLFGAAAFFNAWAGFHDVDRAWIYVGLSVAAWAALSILSARRRDLLAALAPVGISATVIATILTLNAPGAATVVLAIGTAGPAVAFMATRRWWLWLVAAAFFTPATHFIWHWLGLDIHALHLVHIGVAAIVWSGLTPFRRYQRSERDIVAGILSWGLWLFALIVACVSLDHRAGYLGPYVALARTPEWAILTLAVAAIAMAVAVEGLRLKWRALLITGTAGLLLAGLLTIAIAQPANVQAYTLPVGIYLVILGLTFRRSPQFLGAHMECHEAVIVSGLLFLTLPAARQALAPSGDPYVLELTAEALLFLALGLILAARWLVAGAVLTFTGIAIRALALYGTQAPYWLTLGIIGMALLGVGTLLLLQRERWDRARGWIGRWWREAPSRL